MVDSDNTNQNNYKSGQDFQIDILKAYDTYIKPIDEMRSKTNVTSPENERRIRQKIGNANARVDSIQSLLKPEIDYQESRCHAFYRLIGFPVYNGVNKYSPGWDKPSPSKNIKLADKKQIIVNPLEGFISLSNKREEFAQNFLSLFSKNTSIDASTIALSSSTNTRAFAAHIETLGGPLSDLVPDTQSYILPLNGRVGKTKPSLKEYIGPFGSVPSSKLTDKRYHIITPFLVDARYDITVPTKQMVAVPFAKPTDLKASETVIVKRPWIEKVIEDRLSGEQTVVKGSLEALQEYVKNNPTINDTDLVEKVTRNFSLSKQQQFTHFIDMIRSMIEELVNAQREIEKIQKEYYWIPLVSNTGPEGGVGVRPLIISQDISDKGLMTDKDFYLIQSLLIKTSNEIVKQYQAATGEGSFAFSGGEFVDAAFNAQNTDAENNVSTQSYEQLNKKRNLAMAQAGKALQKVEIIMGEFSGLGLCDIFAIIASLYLIPIEDLLGFLDSDALYRSQIASNVSIVPSSLETSMTSLTNTVKDFYNLMDKMYEDISNNNTRS